VKDGVLPPGEVARLEAACASEKTTTKARAAARVGKTGRIEEECACARLGSALMWLGPNDRRRGLDITIAACEDGANFGCDGFELARSLCLVQPERPECDVLRDLDLIPRASFPLEAILGCFSRGESVMCISKTELHVRDRAGEWSVRPIKSWQRDDTRREPRWAADLDSTRAVVARGTLLESPCSRRSDDEQIAPIDPSAASCGRDLLAPGPIYPASERLRDEAAKAIQELSAKLRACDAQVHACWRAAESRIVPPSSEEWDMYQIIAAPAASRSLAGCRAEGERVVAELRKRVPNATLEACRNITTPKP